MFVLISGKVFLYSRYVSQINKEVPSDSLQNPSDPDADYSKETFEICLLQLLKSTASNL